MAIGTSGWKVRQERARLKNVNSKADRAAIREARKAHYVKQLAQGKADEQAKKVLQARIAEAVKAIESGAPDPEPEQTAETNERDTLTAELDARGVRWHPRMKDETLQGLLDDSEENDSREDDSETRNV